MIHRPRQWGPPLPKNLGQREAKVLIYATAELPFFGDFFETFPDGFPKILWVYDILGTFPNNLSKTACQNSYWFESYRTLKLADFSCRTRSSSSPSPSDTSLIAHDLINGPILMNDGFLESLCFGNWETSFIFQFWSNPDPPTPLLVIFDGPYFLFPTRLSSLTTSLMVRF